MRQVLSRSDDGCRSYEHLMYYGEASKNVYVAMTTRNNVAKKMVIICHLQCVKVIVSEFEVSEITSVGVR